MTETKNSVIFIFVTMNRNILNMNEELYEISKTLSAITNEDKIYSFLVEILTGSELKDISKRWRILKLLKLGVPQREIAKELGVSLCNITRGAKIIKNNNAIVNEYLKRN